MNAQRVAAILVACGALLALAAACSDDEGEAGSATGSGGGSTDASGGFPTTGGSSGSSGKGGVGGSGASGGASGSPGTGGASGAAGAGASGGTGGGGGGHPCGSDVDCMLAYRAGLCCGECQIVVNRPFLLADPCYCANGETCNPPLSCQENDCDGGCPVLDCEAYVGAECLNGFCHAIPVGSSGPNCCPQDPPAAGAACPGTCVNRSCTWLRCAALGEITATCGTNFTWSVSSQPCASSACYESTCLADQVCVEHTGGQFMSECQTNPCGDGPITCDCAAIICGSEACEWTAGRTIRCDSCPSGICP